MVINILLPYKDKFDIKKPSSVSITIQKNIPYSKFKNNIKIFGSENLSPMYKDLYCSVPRSINPFKSKNKHIANIMCQNIIKLNNPYQTIEMHNRPYLFQYVKNLLPNYPISIFFHNDPLTMVGSKSIEERKYLLKNCYRIIFNSNWSKKRFLEKMENKFINSEKLLVAFQSTLKPKNVNIKKKKNWITFVGKLNRAKGYDIFGKSVIKILNKFPEWQAQIVGDERREEINFHHKNLNKLETLTKTKIFN